MDLMGELNDNYSKRFAIDREEKATLRGIPKDSEVYTELAHLFDEKRQQLAKEEERIRKSLDQQMHDRPDLRQWG